MQFENFFFIVCIVLGFGLMIYYFLYFQPKAVKPGTVKPANRNVIQGEYRWLLEHITRANSRIELHSLEGLLYEFQKDHQSHAYMEEMFTDLMIEIQARHNILSVRLMKMGVE